MYQPYPGSNEPAEPRPSVPPAVRRASQVMYVGAAASLIGIAVDFTQWGAIKDQIARRNTTMTPDKLAAAQHLEIGVLIAGGLIAAALWVWMAQSNKAGKSWARVVATVLFGIDTLSQFVGAVASPGGIGRIYGLVVWVIGLVAIVLLWQRPATAFFKAAPRN